MIWNKIISKIKKYFSLGDLLSPYKVYCYDEDSAKFSLGELLYQLNEKLSDLEERINTLEMENIETTNELYRSENSLDARIDILAKEFYDKYYEILNKDK